MRNTNLARQERSVNSLMDFNQMFNDMETAWDHLLGDFGLSPFAGLQSISSEFIPRIDLLVDEKACHVYVETAGIGKDDLTVEITEDNLNVRGKKESKNVENAKSVLSERVFGSFSRTISLPSLVTADKVVSEYKDGILHLTIPLAEPKTKPKVTTVKIE